MRKVPQPHFGFSNHLILIVCFLGEAGWSGIINQPFKTHVPYYDRWMAQDLHPNGTCKMVPQWLQWEWGLSKSVRGIK
jgi:hypothetical protein